MGFDFVGVFPKTDAELRYLAERLMKLPQWSLGSIAFSRFDFRDASDAIQQLMKERDAARSEAVNTNADLFHRTE